MIPFLGESFTKWLSYLPLCRLLTYCSLVSPGLHPMMCTSSVCLLPALSCSALSQSSLSFFDLQRSQTRSTSPSRQYSLPVFSDDCIFLVTKRPPVSIIFLSKHLHKGSKSFHVCTSINRFSGSAPQGSFTSSVEVLIASYIKRYFLKSLLI